MHVLTYHILHLYFNDQWWFSSFDMKSTAFCWVLKESHFESSILYGNEMLYLSLWTTKEQWLLVTLQPPSYTTVPYSGWLVFLCSCLIALDRTSSMLNISSKTRHPFLVSDLKGKTFSLSLCVMLSAGFSQMPFIKLRKFSSIHRVLSW